jgi:hypothetical protein
MFFILIIVFIADCSKLYKMQDLVRYFKYTS